MKNTFIDFIGNHFDKLKGKFKTQIRKIGFEFDDDVFSDTILKCHNKFLSEKMLESEMENYFWTAFKTNTIRELRYSRNKNKVGEEMITDELLGSTDDEENDIYEDYEKISNMIIDEFGMDLYKLFSLHANGIGYNQLAKTNDINELKYQFRKIREYIRKNYKKE